MVTIPHMPTMEVRDGDCDHFVVSCISRAIKSSTKSDKDKGSVVVEFYVSIGRWRKN
jgi:hypothetical protein